MEAISKVFDHVSGFAKKLTELLLTVLSLGVVAQVLLGDAMFGMDVIGNVVKIIELLGNSGFVGIVAVIVLYGILNKGK